MVMVKYLFYDAMGNEIPVEVEWNKMVTIPPTAVKFQPFFMTTPMAFPKNVER